MNRKIIIKSLPILLVFLAGYISCNKKDLNVSPPTQSENSYFQSEDEFRTAIIGVYAAMTDFYSSSNVGGGGSAELEIQFLPGDDLTNNGSEVYEDFIGLNPSDAKITQFFQSCYVFMSRANTVLNKIENVPSGIYTTPNLKDNNEGEMLFLRAFGHYQLWNVYGTAPLDTAVVASTNELNPPSSKGTELLDQAITDLTRAATLLPASWDVSNTGRVTANSAYGLLGKCLVFRATINKNAADYQAALSAFNKISGVSLVANFEDNFDVNKENNAESLFEFQAGAPILGAGATNAWLSNDQANIGVASAFWNCFGAGNFTSYMGGGVYAPTAKLVSIYDTADPRLPYTISGNTITKYILNDLPEGAANSMNNPRILRYADVLLLEAEATLQSGGNTTDAIALINTVRARARNMVAGGTVPADLDNTVSDKTVIMQWIMDERLRELAAEGQRWYDLRRWQLGGFITLNNDFFSSITPTRMGYDAHFLNFPIPNSETEKNPNIVQNSGY